MNQQNTLYCEICSEAILSSWRGWPHKDVIPLLPRIEFGKCPCCSNEASPGLVSSRITWFNYHGAFSTGLPDYWLLVIDGDRKKWGLPYFAEGVCPLCKGRSAISKMKFPNGTCELMHNCEKCGLSRAG